jgi:hypothetical protein
MAANTVKAGIDALLTLSPSMSGKSFVTAITVANIVINLAMKVTLGDQLNEEPIAFFTA